MLTADVVKDYVQTVMLPGETSFEELEKLIDPMVERGTLDVNREGIQRDQIQIYREMDMRYEGQGFEITLGLTSTFMADFHRSHHDAYGHSAPDAPIEIVNLRVRAVGGVQGPQLDRLTNASEDASSALIGTRPFVDEGGSMISGPCYRGSQLNPGNVLVGPALVIFDDTTIYLPVETQAQVDQYLNLVIEGTQI
jgi:N-methylhydantoinase A